VGTAAARRSDLRLRRQSCARHRQGRGDWRRRGHGRAAGRRFGWRGRRLKRSVRFLPTARRLCRHPPWLLHVVRRDIARERRRAQPRARDRLPRRLLRFGVSGLFIVHQLLQSVSSRALRRRAVYRVGPFPSAFYRLQGHGRLQFAQQRLLPLPTQRGCDFRERCPGARAAGAAVRCRRDV
jgi:hypothetical protein